MVLTQEESVELDRLTKKKRSGEIEALLIDYQDQEDLFLEFKNVLDFDNMLAAFETYKQMEVELPEPDRMMFESFCSLGELLFKSLKSKLQTAEQNISMLTDEYNALNPTV